MIITYTIRDKADREIKGDCTQRFNEEGNFRKFMRQLMKGISNAHYCEYYEVGVPKTRLKTIANF